ncbi:MAG: Ig-like domain-containing protein [Lachnospiraceae bacterium]|nr:Ig-like domain-containing protein [Lachnospiraceae bacterium]
MAEEDYHLNIDKTVIGVGEEFDLLLLDENDIVCDAWYHAYSPGIVEVSDDGHVTGLSKGHVSIGVTSKDYSFDAVCDVEVIVKNGLCDTNLTLKVDEEYYLYYMDGEGNYVEGTFTSSDPETVYADDWGTLRALKTGSATITYVSWDGSITATCEVKVIQGLNYHNYTFSLEQNMTPMQLSFWGENNESVAGRFYNGDETIATVDANGLVTPKAVGTTWISFVSNDDKYQDECIINVAEEYSLTARTLVVMPYTSTTLRFNGPEGETSEGIWTSSNENVATYDNGWVSGGIPGTAIISYTSLDGEYEDSCTVHVIRGFENDDIKLLLEEGKDTAQLEYRGIDDAVIAGTYESSSPEVATVDNNGLVTAVGEGYTYIEFSAVDSETGYNYSDTCRVEVVRPYSLSQNNLVLRTRAYPYVYFYGADGEIMSEDEFTTSSTDETIAYYENGCINTVHPGTATITFTSLDGHSAECNVRVYGFNYGSLYLTPDTPEPVQLIFSGTEKPIISFEFSSDNEEVATVDQNGFVTPVGLGTAYIKYEGFDGEKSWDAFCCVSVSENNYLSETEIEMTLNDNWPISFFGIDGEALPESEFTVHSENENIAYYEDGIIHPVGIGSTTITFTRLDESRTASCIVNVHPGLNYKELNMAVGGEPVQLKYLTMDESEISGSFEVDFPDIVDVSEAGMVTPLLEGSTWVYFRAEVDGKSYRDECYVQVRNALYSLSKTNPTFSLGYEYTDISFYGPDGNPLSEDEFTTSSDHPEVAYYENGYIQLVSAGEARITFTPLGDESHSVYCDVTVVNGLERKDILFTGLENYEPVKIIFHGVNDAVIAADNIEVDNPSVVRVDDDGYIHPVGVGYAYIYFYGHDDSHDYYEACYVKVTNAYSLSMDSMVTTRHSGYGIEFYGADGNILSEDEFTWESSNPDVAYYQNGVVFGGEQPGEADITFYTLDRLHYDTCHVTVVRGLEPREIDFIYGEENEPVPVAFYGLNDELIADYFSIDDESVATFDENGCVIPVGLGNTWLYFSNYENGNNYSDSIPITVRNAYYLSDYEIILSPRTARSIHFYGPDGEDLDNSEYSVVSENPEVAQYDNESDDYGSISFVGLGETDITFTTNNGFSQTCHVYCVRGLEPQDISFNLSGDYDPVPLVFYGIGDEIVNGGSYSAEDTSIADVDEAGNVYPVGPGKTAVHFDYNDDQHYYFGYCTVTVTKAYTLDRHEIILSKNSVTEVVFYGADGERMSDDEFTVESSDPTVAYYEDGWVYTAGAGTAQLTFTVNGTDISDVCEVTVYEGLNYHYLRLFVGSDEDPVQLIFTGPEGYDSSGYFESEDTHIATVDENGYVTPVSAGNIYIDYYSYNGNFYDNCRVEVLDSTVLNHLTEHEITFDGIDEYEFLEFLDENGNSTTDGTWTSSDENVATVEDGIIIAVGYGSAVITYTSPKGIIDTCTVTVYGLNRTDLEFWVGGNMEPVTLFYQDMQGQQVSGTWTSDNEEVATVDANGVVTPVGEGYAVITFTYESDGHSIEGKCYVSVRKATYQLNTHEMWVPVGRTGERLSFSGENGSTKEGTWSSSDESAVTVDQNGNVTGITVGASATIHYISPDGQHEDDCLVTVIKGLDRRSMTLTLGGESGQLTYTNDYWTPTYGYMWQSTNESVVTVKGGLVTPVGVGTAKVWVQTLDNPFDYDWCDVTVVEETHDYGLNFSELQISVDRNRFMLAFKGPDGETIEGNWTSSNEDVAYVKIVDNVPLAGVCGVSVGDATITYTSYDEQYTASCLVHVVPGLNYHELTLPLNSEGVELIYTGRNGVEEGLFQSLSTDIADIVDGAVVPLSVGTAVIEFFSDENIEHYDYCVVNVVPAPVDQLNMHHIDIMLNDTFTGLRYIDENGVETTEGTWATSDTSVAVVYSDASIVGTGVGTAEIDYINAEGVVKDTCTVTVYQGLNTDRLELWYGGENKPGHLEFTGPDGIVEGTFTSYNTNIAAVSSDGTVTPTGVGSTDIEFISNDGKYVAYCSVTVNGTYYLNREIGHTVVDQGLSLFFYGDNGEILGEDDYNWSSSKPDVATYDKEEHLVRGLSVGLSDFTFSCFDDTGYHSDECRIYVHPGLNYQDEELYVGDTLHLFFKMMNGTVAEGHYQAGPSNVITVDQNGIVTAVGTGTGYVTFFADSNDLVDSCRITVTEKPQPYLNYTEKTIHIGETFDLIYYDENGQPVSENHWTIRGINVAYWRVTGRTVIGLSVGTATFTFDPNDGEHEPLSCVVHVYQGLNYHNMDLWYGQNNASKQLFFTDPDGQQISGTFSGGDPAVATVDSAGNVTPVGLGTCTVNFTSDDGQYTDQCKVTVKQEYSMNIDYREAVVQNGIDLFFYDENGNQMSTDRFTWTTTDENVVVFDPQYDVVRAVGPGEADITFTSNDGLHSDTCHFKIHPGLNERDIEMTVGEEKQLTFTLLSGETVPFVFFGVEDERIIRLDADGTLTGLAPGYTGFNVQVSVNGVGLGDSGRVTVREKPVEYKLSFDELTLSLGMNRACMWMNGPDGIEYDGTWESSNPDVAVIEVPTMETDGAIIKGLGIGTTTITYTSHDGIHKATCEVTVVQGLNYKYLEIGVGDPAVQLTYTGANGVPITEGFRWESSNPEVATVVNGLVTPVAPGTTTITYYADSTLETFDVCTVTVSDKPIEYKLNFDELTLSLGRARSDLYMNGPDGPEDDGTWESSNPEVAKITFTSAQDPSMSYVGATIEAFSLGTTTITYTSHDGEHTATCEVTVVKGLNIKDLTMTVEDAPVQLTYTGADGIPTTNGTWYSVDESVVTVLNGQVTPVAPGSTVVVYEDPNDENIYDHCMIVVTERPVTYELNTTYLDIPVYKEGISTGTAQLQLIGDDGSIASAVWYSSNESVATVDPDGLVHARKYGKATICAVLPSGQSFECELQTRFWDVAGSPTSSAPNYQYYYKAVYWAADHDPLITRGYDLEYFGVGMNCARKEFMLFLYRMAGNPTITSAELKSLSKKFSDVSGESTTFRKAIAWGVKVGITNGYSDGTFKPNDSLTRSDAMIMLWRYYGKMAPKNNDYSKIKKFTDKPANTSSAAYKAIAWAASYSITNGYTKQSDVPAGYGFAAPCFGNSIPIQREQMIYFLYKAVNNFGEAPRIK